MEDTLISNNLLKLLFEEIDRKKNNFNESDLLAVLAKGLKGTLDIVNANFWKINSFKNSKIKKYDNEKEYFTLIGCYGYKPYTYNIDEFVHDTNTGFFSTIYGQFANKPYFEISLSQDFKLNSLHAAPDRIVKYNLDHLIIVPIIFEKPNDYEWQGILNLYVKPYDYKSKSVFDSHIKSVKAIFRLGLQNINRYHSAELIKTVIKGFKQSRTGKEKNKDTASILYFLMTELRRFIAFDTCSIFIWDPIQQKLVLRKSLTNEFISSLNANSQTLNPSYFRGEGKTGKVFQTRDPLIIDNINVLADKSKFLYREKTERVLKSFMAAPIIHPARPLEVLGVIRLSNRLNQFNNRIIDYFSLDDYLLIDDFSSLLALHLEVEQSEKIRKVLAKQMAHEIAGPILSTRNDAHRILIKHQQNQLKDWQLVSNLNRIIETAKLLQSISQDIEYIGKDSEAISRSKLYMEITSVSFIKEILEPAREVVIPLLRECDFKPNDIIFEGEDFRIFVDKEAFIQVFVNLFSNAIKYRNIANHSTPLIAVSWTVDKNQPISISVTDHGCGIAKENTERVFYFGFREIETIQNNVRGLGIGLSVVRKIINDFHSEITITSNKNPTTFTIILSSKLNGIDYTREARWLEKTK